MYANHALLLGLSTLLLLLLTACNPLSPPRQLPTEATGAPENGAASAADSGATTRQPVSGGRLVYALGFEPSNFSPITGASYDAHLVFRNVYDTLVFLDPQGQFRPSLAQSWEISPDGRSYTFTLREGVTFHDGTPFNAEAVKFTFDTIANPTTRSLTARDLLGPSYESTEVMDAHTVRVRFSQPYAPFLNAVSQAWLAPISPTAYQQYGADYGMHQVGTGPFRWQEYVPRERITLVRNEAYAWAPEGLQHTGPAYLQSVEFRFIPEAGVRVGTLQSGEVHVAEDLPPKDVVRLQTDQRFRLVQAQVPGLATVLFLNTTKPPTDSVEVRRAINYALDRDTLINTLFSGLGEPAQSVLSPTTLGYSRASERYRYDPGQARRLLDQAGWEVAGSGLREKAGVPLELVINTFAFNRYPEILQMVQAQLREVGIGSSINVLNFAQMRDAVDKNDYHLIPHFMPSADPYVLGLNFHSRNIEHGFAYAKYRDPLLDEILDQGAHELDESTRLELYAQAQQLLMEQAAVAPLYPFTNHTVARAEVQNLVLDRAGWDPLLYDVFLHER